MQYFKLFHLTTVDLPEQEPELSVNCILLHILKFSFTIPIFYHCTAVTPAIIPDALVVRISLADLQILLSFEAH